MTLLLLVIFCFGYLAISLEEPLKLNKAALGLFIAVILWTLLAVFSHAGHDIHQILSEHLAPIAEIIFFLMGAMTIVEVIDRHQGFRLITDRIKTRHKRTLLIILGVVTFVLSSVLDNLATTIVMIAIMSKFITDLRDKTLFTGIIVIAANAGGAFSPIGDITTTMLWIGGQISPLGILSHTILPSVVAFAVPLVVAFFLLKNDELQPTSSQTDSSVKTSHRVLIFSVGVGSLILVPFFKLATGLPPFMGILGALGIVWILTELLHRKNHHTFSTRLSVTQALREIDLSSILFFVGILLAVSALETGGVLKQLAQLLEASISNKNLIPIYLGGISAVFDNVPLVAASMQMYPLAQVPMDNTFWLLLAYAAGTGGSMLIIGSAAGVTAMGMTKVSFGNYALRIAPLALIGYLAGITAFVLQSGLGQ